MGLPAIDTVRWTRDPELPGIEVMRATWVSHVFARHMHEAYTIGVNDAGKGVFDCRGEPRVTAPDSLNLINPGDVHTGRAAGAEGWTYRNLCVDVEVMRVLVGHLGGNRSLPHFPNPLVHDGDLARSFRRLVSAIEQPSSRLERESLLLSTLGYLLTRHAVGAPAEADGGRERQAVERARAYLEAHYADEVSVAKLAAEVGVSPFHLIRTFQRTVGLSPHRYQTALRVQAAHAALRSELPIAQIAVETGFYDQSHLTRCFKRALGAAPGQYRASAVLSKTTEAVPATLSAEREHGSPSTP
jgi:AraC-like DNA-binding protein